VLLELIQGSETSVNYNLTPGKYPEENIQMIRTALLCDITHHKVVIFTDVLDNHRHRLQGSRILGITDLL